MSTDNGEMVPGKLSKVDVKALRQADSVSFHFTDGKHQIVARKTIENPGPFDDKQKTYSIDVLGDVVVYDKDGNRDRESPATCYASVYQWKYDTSVWKTIASILKHGDVITLEWFAGSVNDYMREVRGGVDVGPIHNDELYLIVRQVGKNKKHPLKFLVETRVSPANSARMVRVSQKEYTLTASTDNRLD